MSGGLSRQSSGFGFRSRRFERNKNISSPSTCESQYCGEPPWPRGSVLGIRLQGSNFDSCVWRTVSSQSSHHPQEVLLAQFSLYVHKGGLKPDSFHFYIAYYLSVLTHDIAFKSWVLLWLRVNCQSRTPFVSLFLLLIKLSYEMRPYWGFQRR